MNNNLNPAPVLAEPQCLVGENPAIEHSGEAREGNESVLARKPDSRGGIQNLL